MSYRVRVRVMVFNTTFNNISVLSLCSVLLVVVTVVPAENHRPAAYDKHNVVSSTLPMSWIRTVNFSGDRY